MKGRAQTSIEKKAIVMRLFVAWISMPELRLGQLISNALGFTGTDCFYIEDEVLVERVETYANKQYP